MGRKSLTLNFLLFTMLYLVAADYFEYSSENESEDEIALDFYPVRDSSFPDDLFTMEQRRNGAITFHIIGTIYMFVALAIVCDEFLLPSLDVMNEKLGFKNHMAGTAFLIAGSSIPQLFTNVVDMTVSFDDIGIHAVIGAAGFNVMLIIGICALISPTNFSVTKWPLIRGFIFFSVALLMLIYFLRDAYIYWYESLLLFLVFIIYAAFVRWNQSKNEVTNGQEELNILKEVKFQHCLLQLMLHGELVQPTKINPRELSLEDPNAATTSNSEVSELEETSIIALPSWMIGRVIYFLVLPIIFPLWLTHPNTRTARGKKLFPITLIISCLWIAGFTYLMIWWTEVIGETINVSPEIMGFIFIAIGTSVPDLITSIVATRRSYGDIAVSSSVSRNIFGLTVVLPLPWFIFNIVFKEPVELLTNSSCLLLILLLMLVPILLSIVCFRFKINKGLGVAFPLLFFILIVFFKASDYGYIPMCMDKSLERYFQENLNLKDRIKI